MPKTRDYNSKAFCSPPHKLKKLTPKSNLGWQDITLLPVEGDERVKKVNTERLKVQTSLA